MISVMYGGFPTEPTDLTWTPGPGIVNPFDTTRVSNALRRMQEADPEGDADILAKTVAKLTARKAQIELELEKVDKLRRELATIERVIAAYTIEPKATAI